MKTVLDCHGEGGRLPWRRHAAEGDSGKQDHMKEKKLKRQKSKNQKIKIAGKDT
jgi:hypothetical protein